MEAPSEQDDEVQVENSEVVVEEALVENVAVVEEEVYVPEVAPVVSSTTSTFADVLAKARAVSHFY